jgi:hypothetical protein
MGNINGWQANFTARCEAVGWSVERTNSNHFKIRDRAGKFLFTFPATPGDKRSMENTLADARRAGLLELEKTVKLRAERDRLARIEQDRQANDAALERTAAANGTSVTASAPETNLGSVDGVTIVATAPAMMQSPIMPKPAPLADAEELLLADDRVVFRCLKPAATITDGQLTGVCHRTFESVGSLRAHITFHARKSLPPQLQKGHKKPTRESEMPATKTAEPIAAAETAVAAIDMTATNVAVTVEGLALRLATAIKMADRVATTAATVKLDLTRIAEDLQKLPQVDPETLAKARQFDTLRGIFTNGADKLG